MFLTRNYGNPRKIRFSHLLAISRVYREMVFCRWKLNSLCSPIFHVILKLIDNRVCFLTFVINSLLSYKLILSETFGTHTVCFYRKFENKNKRNKLVNTVNTNQIQMVSHIVKPLGIKSYALSMKLLISLYKYCENSYIG